MRKPFLQSLFPIVISAVVTFVAVNEVVFPLAWVCLMPAFYCIRKQRAKEGFLSGLLFGGVWGAISFYWMIPGAEKFTGHSVLYGIAVFIVSAVFLALFFGALFYAIVAVRMRKGARYAYILDAVAAAAVFVTAEFLLMFVSSGFPWFDFHAGYAVAGNLYAIQPASFFGIHILTFVVVLVNYLFALLITEKKWKRLIIPLAIITVYLVAGYLLLAAFEQKGGGSSSFQVAILGENIPPDIKWDDNNGDALVHRLLDLNREAVALKPGLALWSESAIPWTYRQDDDLVNEVLKITAPAHITHVMGINSAFSGNEVYNSAYCILPDGRVAGRYDKQYLLSFVEKPMGGVLVPFFSNKGFSVKDESSHAVPLVTPYGRAGVMICNESTVPVAAAKMAQEGAQFILNMSNDGWFSNTYIVGLHFINARLRAVENRKDVAVNCNNGISGLVQASGREDVQESGMDPFVKVVSVTPNGYVTLASSSPFAFVYACIAYLVCIFFFQLSASARSKRHAG